MSALRAVLLLGLFACACSVWNRIDVCENAMPVERTLNGTVDGKQAVAGPRALGALPGGGSMLIYQSEVANPGATNPNQELRLARLNADGTRLGAGCQQAGSGDDVIAAVPAGATMRWEFPFVAPPGGGRTGLVAFMQWTTWDDGSDKFSIWGRLVDESGCPVAAAGSDPFAVSPASRSFTTVAFPQVVALPPGPTTDNFAVFWFAAPANSARGGTIRGRAVNWSGNGGPTFPATDPSPDGSEATLYQSDETIVDLAAVGVGPDRVAVFWTEITQQAVTGTPAVGATSLTGRVLVAFFDSQLTSPGRPQIVDSGFAWPESAWPGGQKLAAAFDGSHVFVTWVRPDDSDQQWRAFGRVIDASGNRVARQGAPDGGLFRLGKTAGASDSRPTVAALAGGGFLTAWRQVPPGQAVDAQAGDLRGLAREMDGAPRFTRPACDTSDFALNSDTTGDQVQSTLATLSSGAVQAAWTDQGPNGSDPGGSVRGALWPLANLFVDPDQPRPASGASVGLLDSIPLTGCLGLAGTAAPGMPCRCSADCAENAWCSTEAISKMPMGNCVKQCAVSADCGPGGFCFIGASGDGTCFATCQKPADCPIGRVCWMSLLSGVLSGVCMSQCAVDSDCESGHCDTYSGDCTDGTLVAGGGLSAPCTRPQDCRSGTCSSIMGNVCISDCQVSRPNCPENATCVQGVPNDDGGMCMATAAEACIGVTAYCARLSTCAPLLLASKYGDKTTCVARREQDCERELGAPGTDRTFTGEALCQYAFAFGDCAKVMTDQIPACQIQGSRDSGASCTYNSQCKSGNCYLTTDQACGTCADLVAAGGDCSRGNCGSGLICNSKNVCIVPGATGDACSADQPCDRTTYFCTPAGICAPMEETVGAACEPSVGCNLWKGFLCASKTSTCVSVRLAGSGEQCGAISGEVVTCAANWSCPSTGTCPSFANDGEACGTAAGGIFCLAPARCVTGRCTLPDPTACN
jgi:hypothetical protein